jgi:hypothetical protein
MGVVHFAYLLPTAVGRVGDRLTWWRLVFARFRFAWQSVALIAIANSMRCDDLHCAVIEVERVGSTTV